MPAPVLKVNTTELRETGAALLLISGELRDAERIVEDYSRAMGHPGLARRLDEMQGSWDDRRNDLMKEIEGLADVAIKAGEGYEDIEDNLVAALEGR